MISQGNRLKKDTDFTDFHKLICGNLRNLCLILLFLLQRFCPRIFTVTKV
jgi:hypothetical protein